MPPAERFGSSKESKKRRTSQGRESCCGSLGLLWFWVAESKKNVYIAPYFFSCSTRSTLVDVYSDAMSSPWFGNFWGSESFAILTIQCGSCGTSWLGFAVPNVRLEGFPDTIEHVGLEATFWPRKFSSRAAWAQSAWIYLFNDASQ